MNRIHFHLTSWTLAALVLAGGSPVVAQTTNQPPPANPNAFSAFNIITERNIFDPNRRPAAAPRPAPKIVDSFALVGTMTYLNQPYAVFDGNNSDYHKVLEPGGKIAGYTVTNINLNAATLVSGTNKVVLDVGTQMRRNEEGRWSVSERAGGLAASYASSGSSSRSDSNHQRSSFSSSRNRSRGTYQSTRPSNGDQGMSNGSGGPEEEGVAPPKASSGGQVNDVVARMMQRRAEQEQGRQVVNGNDNTNSDQ